MRAISCKLECFENPLNLLPRLTEKNRIDIYGIPTAEVMARYLDYVYHMKRENLNIVSEFLVMAVTLPDVKARTLPSKEVDGEGEEIDLRAELVMRLLKYKKCRLTTNELVDREDGALKHLYKPSTPPPEVTRYEPPVDLDKLLGGLTLAKPQRILKQVMEHKENKIDSIRSNFGTIYKGPVSPEQRIGNVLLYARRKRRFSFRELPEGQPNKLEVVTTLLAALEFMKIGKIHLNQEKIFRDTDIETLGQEGEEEELDLAQLGDFGG